jgi:hypothetical protein
LPGYFGTHLVYLADAVTARLAAADKDSVPKVRLYTGQTAQIGDIGIDSKGTGDNL